MNSALDFIQHLDLNSFNVLIGFLGPLIVAAVTGLKTPSWVKAALSVLVGTIVAVGTVYFTKGLAGDFITNLVQVLVVWQTSYSMIWKGTGIAGWLQTNIPINWGVDWGQLFYVPTGTPVPTDNSVRPIDGAQPPQDPEFAHDFLDDSEAGV
jgi:hypothetical protein